MIIMCVVVVLFLLDHHHRTNVINCFNCFNFFVCSLKIDNNIVVDVVNIDLKYLTYEPTVHKLKKKSIVSVNLKRT